MWLKMPFHKKSAYGKILAPKRAIKNVHSDFIGKGEAFHGLLYIIMRVPNLESVCCKKRLRYIKIHNKMHGWYDKLTMVMTEV